MVYKLNIEHKIEKNKFFKNLHIDENTEAYRNADEEFAELFEIIRENMKLTVLYQVVDPFDLHSKELTNSVKYVLCFISSKDDISGIVNDLMSSGNYLKGYLLNEMATYIIFNASNEMNNIIKEKSKKLGFKLSKRIAPGDGDFELENQKTILDFLKTELFIDAYITEHNTIIPQKSLLYLYGLKKITPSCKNVVDSLMEESCSECSNINCQYRDVI